LGRSSAAPLRRTDCVIGRGNTQVPGGANPAPMTEFVDGAVALRRAQARVPVPRSAGEEAALLQVGEQALDFVEAVADFVGAQFEFGAGLGFGLVDAVFQAIEGSAL
jgi:hypothetical protein